MPAVLPRPISTPTSSCATAPPSASARSATTTPRRSPTLFARPVRAQPLLPVHDGAPRRSRGGAAHRGAERRDNLLVVAERGDALVRHRRLLPRSGDARNAPKSPSPSPTRCRAAGSARACSSGSPRSARDRGVRAFDAFVLGDNLAMMDVFLQSGFTLTQELDQGVFHVALDLEPTAEFDERGRPPRRSWPPPRRCGRSSSRAASRSIGANRRARPHRIGDPAQPAAAASPARSCRCIPHADDDRRPRAPIPTCATFPATSISPSSSCRAAQVARCRRRLHRQGRQGAGRHQRRLRGNRAAQGRRSRPSWSRRSARPGVRMIGPNCMGIVNTDPGVPVNATFSPVVSAAGTHRVLDAERRARPGDPRLREAAQHRHLELRVDRQQGGRLGQRSAAVLGRGSAHRRHPAVPRELRQPAQVRARSRGASAARKPIVAVKAGRSDAGARAASSHTGARATQRSAGRDDAARMRA